MLCVGGHQETLAVISLFMCQCIKYCPVEEGVTHIAGENIKVLATILRSEVLCSTLNVLKEWLLSWTDF